MTTNEARQVLLRFRSWGASEDDPEMAEALELVRQDRELEAWFQAHVAWQESMRRSFRALPVPPAPHVWRRPERPVQVTAWVLPLLAAAAAVALLALVGLDWSGNPGLVEFRQRMVSAVRREYSMDITTRDDAAIRAFLRAHQAPADYGLPPGLEGMSRLGAGLLRWQGAPVSMVCLETPQREPLFLFVVAGNLHQSLPGPAQARVAEVSRMSTAVWNEAGKTYLLASHGDALRLAAWLGTTPGG